MYVNNYLIRVDLYDLMTSKGRVDDFGKASNNITVKNE